MRVIYSDERNRGLSGWEVDRTTDLAVEGARRWIGVRGTAAATEDRDVAMVELSDRPSARNITELTDLARRSSVVLRLWEAVRRPRAPEEQEDHLRLALSVAHLAMVEDRGHLVRLASRVDVDPWKLALCGADYGLLMPVGDGVVDLREGIDRGELAGARVVVASSPSAGFAEAVLRSGRGLVAVGAERPLPSCSGARVHLLDGDASASDVGAAVERAARASWTTQARQAKGPPRPPGWWERIKVARAALEPQHG